jgi:hypothetical protein
VHPGAVHTRADQRVSASLPTALPRPCELLKVKGIDRYPSPIQRQPRARGFSAPPVNVVDTELVAEGARARGEEIRLIFAFCFSCEMTRCWNTDEVKTLEHRKHSPT